MGRSVAVRRPTSARPRQAPYRFPPEPKPTLSYSGNVDGRLVESATPAAAPSEQAATGTSFERVRREETERRRNAEASFSEALQRERESRQQAAAEFERIQQQERRKRQETEAAFARALEQERRARGESGR
jgi:hypothetical protein